MNTLIRYFDAIVNADYGILGYAYLYLDRPNLGDMELGMFYELWGSDMMIYTIYVEGLIVEDNRVVAIALEAERKPAGINDYN